MLKTCSRCHLPKPRSTFHKNRSRPDGLASVCSACKRLDNASYHAAHKDEQHQRCRDYRAANLESLRLKDKERNESASRREWRRAYDENNSERRRERERTKYQSSEADRQRIKRNRQKLLPWLAAYMRSWKKENADRWRLIKANSDNKRRLAKAAYFEKVDLAAIEKRDKMICHLCGKKVARHQLTFDHLIPLSKDGPHVAWNLAVAHRRCNSQKSNRFITAAQPPLL